MTEHPFTPHPETLAAILNGATQFRVPLDPQPPKDNWRFIHRWVRGVTFQNDYGLLHDAPLPYAVGDVLWLREEWRVHKAWDDATPSLTDVGSEVWSDRDPTTPAMAGRRRSADTMPRWASRLSYRITAVRVERVQDITEDDCHAEGYEIWSTPDGYRCCSSVKGCFYLGWDAIHGDGAWERNDWVAAYTFEVVK